MSLRKQNMKKHYSQCYLQQSISGTPVTFLFSSVRLDLRPTIFVYSVMEISLDQP